MKFSVYILKSEKVDKYYIGSTQNLDERVQHHNGRKARWTKRYQPWVLVHFEKFNSRAEAVRRERFFKSLKGIEKNLERIKSNEL